MSVSLPWKFPNEADKIAEIAQEFRCLTPTERLQRILDLIASGKQLMAQSPRRQWPTQHRAAQEELWRRVHKEVFARYGGQSRRTGFGLDSARVRPAVAVPLEVYSPERQAEFLLSNAVDAEDYVAAMAKVRELEVDPDNIPHRKPAGA